MNKIIPIAINDILTDAPGCSEMLTPRLHSRQSTG